MALILGIETSCDETGVALVRDSSVLADRTTTQLLHEEYGGVVPELASRAHERLLMRAVTGVLDDVGVSVSDVDAVAATCGPGLAGALLVGVSFAKGLAYGLKVPLIGVNHLEAHLWGVELTHGKTPLPFLGMIVSGGHTLTVGVSGFGKYRLIGATHDDAAGELFDKVGRMLGIGFPAGASIDRDALEFKGEPVYFPRASVRDDDFGFSFSGLKTAVLYYLRERYKFPNGCFDVPIRARQAISAGIMASVADMLLKGLEAAWMIDDYRALIISGGVAASGHLRKVFEKFASEKMTRLFIPPAHHCTDNGAMVAYAGNLLLNSSRLASLELEIDPAAEIASTDLMLTDKQSQPSIH